MEIFLGDVVSSWNPSLEAHELTAACLDEARLKGLSNCNLFTNVISETHRDDESAFMNGRFSQDALAMLREGKIIVLNSRAEVVNSY